MKSLKIDVKEMRSREHPKTKAINSDTRKSFQNVLNLSIISLADFSI